MDRYVGLGLCILSHESALVRVLGSFSTLNVALMYASGATRPILHLHWSTTAVNKRARSSGRGLAACRAIGAILKHASAVLWRRAGIDLLMLLCRSHIIEGFSGDRPQLLLVIAAQEVVLLITVFLEFVTEVGCFAPPRRLAVSCRSTFQLLLH